MGVDLERLEVLKRKSGGYWADRILSQLAYAAELSKAGGGKHDGPLNDAIRFLDGKFAEDGAVTKGSAVAAENMLAGLAEAAKSLRVICAAHAHIDMNWLWGFAETGAVTLDTFRTMLDLMNEYPDFKFSQSQASVYRIVEEYAPEMLEEIKTRVREGRWEVTASSWVESDKNMPSGESLARHILYTKKYLSGLLGIDPDSLNLDFEPDTFGHNGNMPEILANGGVKYYYHCRGYAGHSVYRWEAPSGNSVIVYRDPDWYNAGVDSRIAACVPEFCARNGTDAMLKVYGVGDHGGGPTRRDIERLIDMSSWPVFPAIRFGTFAEYFGMLEKIKNRMPVVRRELNFMFTGCYTSQARIKLANRISEAKLNEAEAFGALSALFAGGKYPGGDYRKAWQKVLFSQFHDILTGSGVTETREYAMGQFQEVLMAANNGISNAFRSIVSQIGLPRPPAEPEDKKDTTSEGAGAGYSIGDYGIPQTERGAGANRIFHVFNPSPRDRRGLVEITLWDWPGDREKLEIKDAGGAAVRYQILDGRERQDNPKDKYWDHEFIRLLADAGAPAYGCSAYSLGETGRAPQPAPPYPDDWRVEKADSFILENDHVKVVFDTADAHIVSFTDKPSGEEMAAADRPAGIFRLVEEDDVKGMTAWTIGRYMNVTNLNRGVKIRASHIDRNALRQWIRYETEFGSSRLSVTVSLDHGGSMLDFSVECDWREAGRRGKYVPQLNFHMPLAYKCGSYKYDIPFGTVEREGMDMDVPANGWALAAPLEKTGGGVMIVANSKYGFRGFDDSVSLSLIRGSYNPDPYPENGVHRFRFAVALANRSGNIGCIDLAYDYNHPLSYVSGVRHGGALPAAAGFARLVRGSVAVSAIKTPEAPEGGNNRLILRVYETEGSDTRAVFSFARGVSKAWYVDIAERAVVLPDIGVDGCEVAFDVNAYSLASVCVEFRERSAES